MRLGEVLERADGSRVQVVGFVMREKFGGVRVWRTLKGPR